MLLNLTPEINANIPDAPFKQNILILITTTQKETHQQDMIRKTEYACVVIITL